MYRVNRILVVVDMQNDFINGSLGTPEAEKIVSKVVAKIKYYRRIDGRVFATKDTHFEATYFDTQEGKNLPVLHCVKGTQGWNFPKEIEELIKITEVWKKETFGSLEAMQVIAKIAKDTNAVVEFCGLCTDICVIANVILFKTLAPEIEVRLDSLCCAGVTPERHEAALETMRSLQVRIL